jgi:hypothetical protein
MIVLKPCGTILALNVELVEFKANECTSRICRGISAFYHSCDRFEEVKCGIYQIHPVRGIILFIHPRIQINRVSIRHKNGYSNT